MFDDGVKGTANNVLLQARRLGLAIVAHHYALKEVLKILPLYIIGIYMYLRIVLCYLPYARGTIVVVVMFSPATVYLRYEKH